MAKKPDTIPIPPTLDTPEFREAWAAWQQHRREIRKKLTPTTVDRQLKKLAKYGPTGAVASIEASIEAGWTGLFDPPATLKPKGLPDAQREQWRREWAARKAEEEAARKKPATPEQRARLRGERREEDG